MDRKWVAAVLVALNLLLWSQTGTFDLLSWDDPDFLTENPNINGGLTAANVKWALTTQFIYWQPLVYLSHQAMVSLFGLQPGPHHLLNVLLHAACAGIFFLVLLRLRFPVWTAAIAVAIYSLHPLRAESVAWVTERKDVLSGVFWWLTIWAYLRYAQDGKKYVWVAVFFALALMSKPVAVTLPVVLLLLDYWPLGRRWEWKDKVPLAVLTAGSVAITLAGQTSADAVSKGIEFGLRASNAIHTYAVYLRQTVWPHSLAGLYGYPASYNPLEIALIAALLAGITWGAWRVRERQPWWLLAWGWYLIVLLPNIGIVQVGEQPHADRYTYLPTSMLIAGVCYGIAERVRGTVWARPAAWGGAALAAVYALGSVPVMAHWRNDQALYGRMLELEPRLSTAHNNLGHALKKAGDLDGAARHFEEAVRLDPTYLAARINAAIHYADAGRPALALPHAEAAAKLGPERADVYLHLGRAQAGAGQVEAAIGSFRKGLEKSKSPATTAPLWMQLGVAEYMRQNDAAALEAFRAALQADPGHWPARKNAAIVLGNLGRTAEAIAEFEAYLRANPGDASVRQAIEALRGQGQSGTAAK